MANLKQSSAGSNICSLNYPLVAMKAAMPRHSGRSRNEHRREEYAGNAARVIRWHEAIGDLLDWLRRRGTQPAAHARRRRASDRVVCPAPVGADADGRGRHASRGIVKES